LEIKEIRLVNLIPSRNLRTERIPEVEELANSIKEHGLLQPVRVRHLHGDTHQIIAGHRRVQAHRSLGRKSIEAVVVRESDETAAVQSIVENLQREDLTPLELARSVQELAKGFDLDTGAISRLISKSPERVRTWRRFSSLPDDVLEKLESGEGRTQRVTGLTPRHIEPFIRDMPSEILAKLDEDAATKYEERLSEVRELQDQVKTRNVSINAHMADAIAKETHNSKISVGEALSKVLAKPERYRYKAPQQEEDSSSDDKHSEMSDSFASYQRIGCDLTNMVNKLQPNTIETFTSDEKEILLSSLLEVEMRLKLCRKALTATSLVHIVE
jgi:ParB family chromosome partitioning protein